MGRAWEQIICVPFSFREGDTLVMEGNIKRFMLSLRWGWQFLWGCWGFGSLVNFTPRVLRVLPQKSYARANALLSFAFQRPKVRGNKVGHNQVCVMHSLKRFQPQNHHSNGADQTLCHPTKLHRFLPYSDFRHWITFWSAFPEATKTFSHLRMETPA